jgi:hypothetical protein
MKLKRILCSALLTIAVAGCDGASGPTDVLTPQGSKPSLTYYSDPFIQPDGGSGTEDDPYYWGLMDSETETPVYYGSAGAGESTPFDASIDPSDDQILRCPEYVNSNLYATAHIGGGVGPTRFILYPLHFFKSRVAKLKETPFVPRGKFTMKEGMSVDGKWLIHGDFRANCVGFKIGVIVEEAGFLTRLELKTGEYRISKNPKFGYSSGCDPYTLIYVVDPYQYEQQQCSGGTGSGGTGSGGESGGGGGSNCRTEYVVIEISYDGGNTWQTWYEGSVTVCD